MSYKGEHSGKKNFGTKDMLDADKSYDRSQ